MAGHVQRAAEVDHRWVIGILMLGILVLGVVLFGHRVSPPVPMTAWAAASRAIGTRNGEHDT